MGIGMVRWLVGVIKLLVRDGSAVGDESWFSVNMGPKQNFFL
jgi:hypothetical protein